MRKIGMKQARKKNRNAIPKLKTMTRAKARRGRHSVHDHLPGEAQAMTQKAEVTAPIRLISPTTLELNQMAEAREV